MPDAAEAASVVVDYERKDGNYNGPYFRYLEHITDVGEHLDEHFSFEPAR